MSHIMDSIRNGCDIKENAKSWRLTCKTCGEKWRARIIARSDDGRITLEPAIVIDRVWPHVEAHARGRSLEVH